MREKVKYIEPGVSVNEQRLIQVPNGEGDAFAVELRVGGFPGGWLGAFKRKRRRPQDITTFTAIAVAVEKGSFIPSQAS